MSVKFHSFLTFWHEVLALMVHNFFDILHIHGQGMGESVVFHISTHTQPSTFGNHIVFFQFIIVFSPFLQGKARGVVCHFEIDDVAACSCGLFLHIKHHSLKDDTIFFRGHFDHWRDFSLFKSCLTLFSTFSKVRGWFWCFFNWRYGCF